MYNKELNGLLFLFNEKIRTAVSKLSDNNQTKISEIRLYKDKEISVVIRDNAFFLLPDGTISIDNSKGIIASQSDIDNIFQIACQYSVHSFKNEIAQGFLTLRGGHRMGLCGTAVLKNDQIETIKDISSLNIRIAREIKGCAVNVYSALFSYGLCNALIVGPPSCGKTTILRDLCRLIGNEHKISVIDERNELGATVNGSAQNDLGTFCDIFNTYPKHEGIMTAIRVMSPKVIICDEIGNENDSYALKYADNSGVRILASAHAGSIDEAMNRKVLSDLFKNKMFQYVVLLGTGDKVGQIVDIRRIGE